MNTESLVTKLPKCSYCNKSANYDGKTQNGPWAFMCEDCFKKNGLGLGTGLGQKLILLEFDMVCKHCGLKFTGEEGMHKGYECCNPDSIEHIDNPEVD